MHNNCVDSISGTARPIMKTTHSPFIIAAILIAVFSSTFCMGKEADNTIVAKIGNETITRGFLSYSAAKLGFKKISIEKKKELLNKIIEQIAVAHHARSIGLDAGKDFLEEHNALIFHARLDYLCACNQYSDNCAEKLYQQLVDAIDLREPTIDWDKVFIKKEAAFIPYGGKIPKSPQPKKESRESSINKAYADAIAITSRHENLQLTTLLLSLNDDHFRKILDSDVDERTQIFHSILLERYIGHLIARLSAGNKALLAEIERRAEQNLLVELYREHIGFEQITGGKASSVRYEPSDEEIRSFYEHNKSMFEEPEWVEISHIRLRDYEKAIELKKKIEYAPGSFCDIAREHSIADDAARCGYIGIVKRAKKLPLFKEFAFTMSREGEISPPFLADGFTEIVKLHRRKTRILPLSDPHVRRLVIEAIQPIKREEKLRRTIEEEKKKLGVEIYNNDF